jgi:aminoglycoside phosphotransferase (APT) family kinase protein
VTEFGDECSTDLRAGGAVVMWIESRSVEALRPSLEALVPELAVDPIVLHDTWVETGNPLWARSSAFVGGKVVKFAWTEPAAIKLAHEISVLQVLALTRLLVVAPVRAYSLDPVLLVTDFEPGMPLSGELCAGLSLPRKQGLAKELAGVLAALHSSEVVELTRSCGVRFAPPVPQANTDELRKRLLPRLTGRQRDLVNRWCNWVDDVLAPPADQVVLHGDFHGHNLVLDEKLRVRRVLDFEEAAYGDYHYDFRYLPAQEATVELFRFTAEHYRSLTKRTLSLERVMAWHVRTVLGDALWRTEARIALPHGGTPAQWIDELDQRFEHLSVNPHG